MRGECLAVLVHSAGRLLAAAAPNVTAWRGLATLSLLCLDGRAGCPPGLHHADLGDDPGVAGAARSADHRAHPGAGLWGCGDYGTARSRGLGPETLPGIACALGAAVLFAFGTGALCWSCLPPSDGTAGRDAPYSARAEPDRLGGKARTAVPTACQVCWSAAMHRVPPGRRRWRPCSPLWSASSQRSPRGDPLGTLPDDRASSRSRAPGANRSTCSKAAVKGADDCNTPNDVSTIAYEPKSYINGLLRSLPIGADDEEGAEE